MRNDRTHTNLTTIILAGGQGSRMGYVQKGVMKVAGRPVIESILDELTPLRTNILISANSRSYNHYGYPVIADEVPDQGPLGGIVSTLRQSTSECNLVVACDMPNVTTSFFRWLLSHWQEDVDAVVPMIYGDTQPLCAIYSKSALPVLEKCLSYNKVKMKEVILDLSMLAVEVPHSARWWDNRILANLNTPYDFVTAQSI